MTIYMIQETYDDGASKWGFEGESMSYCQTRLEEGAFKSKERAFRRCLDLARGRFEKFYQEWRNEVEEGLLRVEDAIEASRPRIEDAVAVDPRGESYEYEVVEIEVNEEEG